MRNVRNRWGGGLAAFCAALALLLVVESPAGAQEAEEPEASCWEYDENGRVLPVDPGCDVELDGEPCQMWVDEVALQEERYNATPGWPRQYRDQARADLAACEGRHSAFYDSSNYGNFRAQTDRRPAQPTPQLVQRYTYSWLNTPPTRTRWIPRTPQQAERVAQSRRWAEQWNGGPIDWYDRPIGGGPNGEITVVCDSRGYELVLEPRRRKIDDSPQSGGGDAHPSDRSTRELPGVGAVIDPDTGEFATYGRPPRPGYACF